MEPLIITAAVGAGAVALFMFIGRKLNEWKKEVEETEFNDEDESESDDSVKDDKVLAYSLVHANIDLCETREDLATCYNMLQLFKLRFGRCEMYCNLYADYVAALWQFTDGKSAVTYNGSTYYMV